MNAIEFPAPTGSVEHMDGVDEVFRNLMLLERNGLRWFCVRWFNKVPDFLGAICN
jgi:hypothetical protein